MSRNESLVVVWAGVVVVYASIVGGKQRRTMVMYIVKKINIVLKKNKKGAYQGLRHTRVLALILVLPHPCHHGHLNAAVIVVAVVVVVVKCG